MTDEQPPNDIAQYLNAKQFDPDLWDILDAIEAVRAEWDAESARRLEVLARALEKP